MIRTRSRLVLGLAVAMMVAACNKSDTSDTSAGAEKTGPGADKSRSGTSGGNAAEPAARAHSRTIASGTALALQSAVTITSRRNHVGDTVTATVSGASLSSTRDTVIPAGSQLVGTITAIAPSEHVGGKGTLTVAFTQLRVAGHNHPVSVRVDSLATTMVGRGVTAGDAGKVGVGAAAGAAAGRLIGGNATGTAVGAAVGAAAGTAVAVETRDTDITLQTGALVRVTLTAPFTRAGN